MDLSPVEVKGGDDSEPEQRALSFLRRVRVYARPKRHRRNNPSIQYRYDRRRRLPAVNPLPQWKSRLT